MIREFSHFEKKDFPVSLCKQNYCKNDFVSHWIDFELQTSTGKDTKTTFALYLLNRFPFIHSCSEIVDLKRKTHHELCFIKHGMNINFSPNVIILSSKYGNVFANVYLCSLESLILVVLTFRLCLNQCVTRWHLKNSAADADEHLTTENPTWDYII